MSISKGNIIISRNPEITAYEIAVAEGFVGTIHGMFKIVVYPGDYPEGEILL